MGFLDHQGESEFPFNKETVFNAMVKAIPTVKGMKIDNADKLQSRIVVKAGVSLMSWGENIPIQLSGISENLTKVKITSTPKTGIMFGGAFDLGKNRKNIEQILSATSRILSNSQSNTTNNITSSENTNKETKNYNQDMNTENQQIDKKWYDNKFITHLLLVIFFPVGLYALWQSRTIAKWWKITATILIGLIVIANLGGNDKNSSTYTRTDKETAKTKQWTVVYEFKGSGMKKSPVFELTGNNARLKYKYQGPSGIGMGMFAVYVVDEGKDIMKEGGFPEVMTQSESEESESSIQKSAGRYYLNVNASGNWTVIVEEEK